MKGVRLFWEVQTRIRRTALILLTPDEFIHLFGYISVTLFLLKRQWLDFRRYGFLKQIVSPRLSLLKCGVSNVRLILDTPSMDLLGVIAAPRKDLPIIEIVGHHSLERLAVFRVWHRLVFSKRLFLEQPIILLESFFFDGLLIMHDFLSLLGVHAPIEEGSASTVELGAFSFLVIH